MKSKRGNHMATFLLAIDYFTPEDVAGFAKDHEDIRLDLFGVQEALASFIYRVLSNRFTSEYSWEGIDCEEFVSGLLCLSEDLSVNALLGMDATLESFIDSEGQDTFVESMNAMGRDSNKRSLPALVLLEPQAVKRDKANARRKAQSQNPTQE